MSSPIHGANGTATSSRASSTVAVNQRERINGWTCPWHPLQFIAWLFLIVFAISYFGVHVFYLPHEWRAAGFIIPGGFCVIHIIYHILALTIDPADRNIRGGTRKDKAFFDRHQHQHVIEDFHCYICQADVGSKSKHCSVCNKCVSDFDHHCKWLNNCVGGRNYRLFIGCIASAFVLAIIVFVVTLRVFIMCFISRDELKSLTDGEFKILTVPIKDDNAFIIFTAIVGGLLLLSIALLGHLLGFHIYLIYHKMSTYEFIVSSRDRTQHNTDVEAGISKSPPSRKVFKNKVKPEEERRESSENERIELTDNARSEGSEENLINEPTVKIINEVSSKAAAKQSRSSTSDPETSQEQPQGYDSPSKRASGVGQYSPRDITQSSSSEESLKEIPPTTPRVAIQPPSDVSRASTSMSQYAQHGSDVTSSPRPGPSRERSDDEDGEELVPSPRGKKPKKRSPNGGVSWETGAGQTTVDASLHKKKKKKLKNRAPDNLPRLATPNRRRPLPPLQIENPEGESN